MCAARSAADERTAAATRITSWASRLPLPHEFGDAVAHAPELPKRDRSRHGIRRSRHRHRRRQHRGRSISPNLGPASVLAQLNGRQLAKSTEALALIVAAGGAVRLRRKGWGRARRALCRGSTGNASSARATGATIRDVAAARAPRPVGARAGSAIKQGLVSGRARTALAAMGPARRRNRLETLGLRARARRSGRGHQPNVQCTWDTDFRWFTGRVRVVSLGWEPSHSCDHLASVRYRVGRAREPPAPSRRPRTFGSTRPHRALGPTRRFPLIVSRRRGCWFAEPPRFFFANGRATRRPSTRANGGFRRLRAGVRFL